MLKMSKKAVKLFALVMVIVLAFPCTLTSCARESDEDARRIACDLVERSYNLNVAYYGSGLACDPSHNVEGGYYAVREDAPFRIKNDLIKETKAVFSERVASDLVSVYIDGTSSYGQVLFPRYITGYDGYLTVYKEYDYVVKKVTKYDTSTLEITKNRRNVIEATVSTSDYSETIEVVLVFEPEGWRIDSPTY